MSLNLPKVFFNPGSNKVDPEHFAGAGGELLVLAMVISWSLTYIYNPGILEMNPLKERVGYNNLCVGWDTPPARYVAAPIFTLIIFLNIRFMVLDWQRADLLGDRISRGGRNITYICNLLMAFSWCVSSLIFVVPPTTSVMVHAGSFVQLVVFIYFAYLANFFEVDRRYHPTGSWCFLAVYGVVSIGFGILSTYQLSSFNEETGERGPIPWWLMSSFDYAWFTCQVLAGTFRPRALSIRTRYSLISDDDFIFEAKAARGVKIANLAAEIQDLKEALDEKLALQREFEGSRLGCGPAFGFGQ